MAEEGYAHGGPRRRARPSGRRLDLWGRWDDRPEKLIYRFDQEAAKARTPYFAEFTGYRFIVRVAQRHAGAVAEIKSRLDP